MWAPRPRTMKGGSPPTALNARTGELTPPGISLRARSKRRLEVSKLLGRSGSPISSHPGRPGEESRRLAGEISEDEIRSRPPDRRQRLEDSARPVDPAPLGGCDQHGV